MFLATLNAAHAVTNLCVFETKLGDLSQAFFLLGYNHCIGTRLTIDAANATSHGIYVFNTGP